MNRAIAVSTDNSTLGNLCRGLKRDGIHYISDLLDQYILHVMHYNIRQFILIEQVSEASFSSTYKPVMSHL